MSARKDGQPKARTHSRYWRPQEDVYLSCWWGLRPDAEIARRLGRTVTALQVRAKRWQQPRKANVLTCRQVARIFGVDPTTPIRCWVRRGWLYADRGCIGAGGHTTVWSFSAESLRRFVQEYSWALDVGRMQPGHWLTGMALQAQAADPWLTMAEAGREVAFCPPVVRRQLQRLGIETRRRPCYGRKGGDPDGCLVVRRRDLAGLAARVAALETQHRSAAMRRARGGVPAPRTVVRCWDRHTGARWTEVVP